VVAIAKRRLARVMGSLAAELLTPSSLEDSGVRARLWRHGIGAQPKGFYSSLVDPADLREVGQPIVMDHGLRLNADGQRRYLSDVFPKYRTEYAAIPVSRPLNWAASPRFYLGNDAFENVDALSYWGMIRFHQPNRIVEIGSGFSTLLAAEAVRQNGVGRVTAIDPFPREFVRRNDLGIELVIEPVEDVVPQLILSLNRGDIVFVDSSHVIRQHGDVTWFFLQILPRLRDGVLVHIHDVHFPFDYPLEFIKSRNVYWTEQYMLHAYLMKNYIDEVLFSSRYSSHVYPAETRAAFPTTAKVDGSSFWMRMGDAQGGRPRV
jgi:hypothetical protein